MISYDKKGNYYCMCRYYFEDKLTPEIRHRVKTIYYDFSIFCIAEVNMNDKTVYEILLEDKTSWKRILVPEDQEIVVLEDIKKEPAHNAN